jgi:signal transduction histidine kinase
MNPSPAREPVMAAPGVERPTAGRPVDGRRLPGGPSRASAPRGGPYHRRRSRVALAVAAADAPSGAAGPSHASPENPLPTDPVPLEAAARAAPAPASRRFARLGVGWSAAAPWLMGIVIALAAWLAWASYDLLQGRLRESGVRFDASVHRFDGYWPLHDAAVEAALALKWDLSMAPGAAAMSAVALDERRFATSAAALQAEIERPGLALSALASAQADGVRRLNATLTTLAGPPSGGSPATVATARAQAQAVLDGLAGVGQEVRRRQSMARVVLDEVAEVRRQVLTAFSVIAAMLVLVAAFAVQWVVVARRERTIRSRAEHLAQVAESERARAETVARDKARFLGMLSHELLTPLQSIWSTMDVIESRGRVEAADPAFMRLKESTRSLRGRIGDLVDFAKMSSGRLETRIRGFQLDKLVDSALRDVEEVLAAKNLDVHWEAGPELARRIYSDPARLRQVIDNLLSNAVKYTERGGIAIHAELLQGASVLRLEIADTGVGISPDEVARLFEPFYRSPATAAMAEGSGLGLAVVRSLVDLMGGTIRFNSCVGQGTSVVLEVPIAEGAEAPADPPLHIDASLPVLVVDDSHEARRAIADVIRALGVEVYEAANGGAGLAEAAVRDYQAIMLDMQMPDMTGFEMAQTLRQPGGRHQKTFLVLISAYHDLDDATATSVFDARLDKPASRNDLMTALARAARGRA